MELTTALGLTLLVALVLVVGHLVRENRATREELANVIRYETQRLERKVDTFTRASSRASLLAEHAVATAERRKASPPAIVVEPTEEDPDPE